VIHPFSLAVLFTNFVPV